jgi:hypothetical protein
MFMRIPLIGLILGTWALTSVASGQTVRTDWESLERDLVPGTAIRLDLPQGRRLEGKVVTVTKQGLSLAQKSSTTNVDRADVVRIYRSVPRSTHRNLWIGVLVGAGVGGGAGAVMVLSKNSDLNPGAAPFLAAVGAGVGALIGHATRKRVDWIEVYSKYNSGGGLWAPVVPGAASPRDASRLNRPFEQRS